MSKQIRIGTVGSNGLLVKDEKFKFDILNDEKKVIVEGVPDGPIKESINNQFVKMKVERKNNGDYFLVFPDYGDAADNLSVHAVVSSAKPDYFPDTIGGVMKFIGTDDVRSNLAQPINSNQTFLQIDHDIIFKIKIVPNTNTPEPDNIHIKF